MKAVPVRQLKHIHGGMDPFSIIICGAILSAAFQEPKYVYSPFYEPPLYLDPPPKLDKDYGYPSYYGPLYYPDNIYYY